MTGLAETVTRWLSSIAVAAAFAAARFLDAVTQIGCDLSEDDDS